jgi:hypothetical protein
MDSAVAGWITGAILALAPERPSRDSSRLDPDDDDEGVEPSEDDP